MDESLPFINNEMKTIVVSAVNIRKGGTLTILRECLAYLSNIAKSGDFRVIALVHKKELSLYPNIEYIEKPKTIKGWIRRLWCEYVTMLHISKQLSPVHLWLSLHDTTPHVKAEKQAVYCQTSFPFLQWKWQDAKIDYKIVLFALFTKFVYRIHIKRNKYLIVQAEWLRQNFSKMLSIQANSIIVAPPETKKGQRVIHSKNKNAPYTFIYVATADCHKNFETLCRAAARLEQEIGTDRFEVVLTLSGTENKYARWLYEQWGCLESVQFAGFMNQQKLYATYEQADCLVFPSRVETWGLPISEFAGLGKPMLLADLPYAHETAAGSRQTAFFDVEDAEALKEYMKRLVLNDASFLTVVPQQAVASPTASSWKELFDLLLQ